MTVSLELFVMMVCSLAAGFIDAVAGGGGLIQLPALMLLFPQLGGEHHVQMILGTNKLVSVSGTLTAALRYRKAGLLSMKSLRIPILCALLGSALGAGFATRIKSESLLPIVAIALLVVLLINWFQPDLGQTRRVSTHEHIGYALPYIGFVIGLYDGFIGPGTGSFMMIAMVLWLGMDFLQSSASSKVLNVSTNLAALAVFSYLGYVAWALAIPLICANVLGGWLGSRTAIKGGNVLVRKVFLVVVTAVLAKLVWGFVAQG